ncbi:MAG: TraR/DksA C4-type zinc finger protein [Candidatus Paceibacterota bacterium]
MERKDLDTKHFKKLLEAEQSELEEDLEQLGRINPNDDEDWEVVKEDLNVLTSDFNELADEFEEFESDAAILNELEIRLNEVNHALKKIEKGTYGICEISGKEISKERLEVNPAARAHAKHADELGAINPHTDE